jgi:small subunit ribosomal protein S8
MVSTDPIADMLTRIRNAVAVHKSAVNMPHSKLKEQVAAVLQKQGFIDTVSTEEVAGFKRLAITLHDEQSNARISHLRRLSKPGRRLYAAADEIPKVLGGRGILVVSTSRGIMTDTEARKARIGGELICEVY